MKTSLWIDYFNTNKNNKLKFDHDDHQLTPSEKKLITKSLQNYQLGESSEGKILRCQAKAYSDKAQHPEYLTAIEHLIREENRHSGYLARFMAIHGIPKIKRGWLDTCFRSIRHLAGIEWSIRVLVTAEVIALTYYSCLAEATGSSLLKMICQRMCEEEIAHIDFQMHHLHEMNFQKYGLFCFFANILHFGLLWFTLFPVWWQQKKVLKIKYSFAGFRQKVWQDFVTHTQRGQESAIRSLIEEGVFSKEVLCI